MSCLTYTGFEGGARSRLSNGRSQSLPAGTLKQAIKCVFSRNQKESLSRGDLIAELDSLSPFWAIPSRLGTKSYGTPASGMVCLVGSLGSFCAEKAELGSQLGD